MSGERQCARPVSVVTLTGHQDDQQPVYDAYVEFCKLNDVGNHQWTVECDAKDECKKGGEYSLGMSSSTTSTIDVEWETFSSVKALSFYVKSLVDKSSNKHHGGFVIIKCATDHDTEAKQILVLPPQIHPKRTRERLVNINLVLASNLTRAGLYHSMKQTVGLMTQLNTLPSSRTEVLDFGLLQDLGGQRNLAALISGSVSPLASPVLLSNFSAGRYVTGQAPGCGNTSWSGLNLTSGLKQLNSTGVTPALCHVRLTPRNEVSILLTSSQLLTSTLSSAHQPHMSVTYLPASSLSPDSDPDLASYLEAISRLSQTVTVLTSLSSSDSSQSLPLFIFIPHKVRSMMPESSWQNLLSNQHSLVSLLDLHDTLLSLLNTTRESHDAGAEDQEPRHGLMSADLDTRQCAGLPRGQFACVCQPQVTSMDREVMEAAADILASLHNSDLARNTDTVCARLRLEAVLFGEVGTHGPDDDFLQLQVVFVLVPFEEDEDEDLKDSTTVVTGTLELDLVSKSLQLNTWQFDKTQRVSRFGCIQQYSSQEDIRADILRWIEMERDKTGVRVDSIFTENNVDCIWMVSKRFPETNLASLVMAAACENPVEVTVKTNRKDEDSLVWKKVERRLTVVSGEIALVNVIMSPIESSRAPDWDYKLVGIKYLDPEEEE